MKSVLHATGMMMDSSSPRCVFHVVNVHDAPFQGSNAAGVMMVRSLSTEMVTFLSGAKVKWVKLRIRALGLR